MNADRIAVIGISGSGKSTFARALAAKSGLPLRHADGLEWMENWTERPEDKLFAMHAAWLAEPRWIIEGWVDPKRANRLDAADLVIDLDLPGWLCALRVLHRMLAAGKRDELPEGCVDRFDFGFVRRVLRRRERPSIEAALDASVPKDLLRFTSPRAARAFLRSA